MTLLKLWLILHVVLGNELPFQCPYKVPNGSREPSITGEGGGGLFPTLSENGELAANTTDVYAQYRASLALVPCDAQAISVFTIPMTNFEHTVSVIFVYDKPVAELKKWLE